MQFVIVLLNMEVLSVNHFLHVLTQYHVKITELVSKTNVFALKIGRERHVKLFVTKNSSKGLYLKILEFILKLRSIKHSENC